MFIKNSCVIVALLALLSTGFAQGTTELKTEKDKVSYSIGLDIGGTFKKQAMDINLDLLAAGLKDAVEGKKALLTDEQVKETMTAYSKTMMEKQAAKAKEDSAKNAEEGKKFLEANKGKEGVKTTASGLQYKVLKNGEGKSPDKTDIVRVNYHGTLPDGTAFDSSTQRGEAVEFPVTSVIKGWSEALLSMKVGDKWKL